MSNSVEMTGATIEEAKSKALAELGVSEDEAEVIVVREPAKGFLGIGSKEAQVIVKLKKEETYADTAVDAVADDSFESTVNDEADGFADAEEAIDDQDIADSDTAVEDEAGDLAELNGESMTGEEDVAEAVSGLADPDMNKDYEDLALKFLNDTFEKMNFDITPRVDREASSEDEVYIRLEGSEVGLTIGRRGETLDALQYLTNLTLGRKLGMGVKAVLDVENYREKRRDTLVNLAERLEKKVIRTRRRVTLEPMNPYERRIIHATLQSSRQVETYSEGQEPNRSVVIDLKGRRRY